MNILAWTLSILLALAFAAAGGTKLATSRSKLLDNPQMAWAGDFDDRQLKAIGAVEVLGAIGLIVPWALDIARVLTPLAAIGLALTMVGALITHGRRGELKQALPANTALLVIAVVVGAIRFSQV